MLQRGARSSVLKQAQLRYGQHAVRMDHTLPHQGSRACVIGMEVVHGIGTGLCAARSIARAFSAAAETPPPAPPAKTSFGGLKDEDRIFTNLYGEHDPFLKVGHRVDACAGLRRTCRCQLRLIAGIN